MENENYTGNTIKRIRTEKGLTQKQLGELCGMADSAIRKYESGAITPKIGTLKRIADALDIDVFSLADFETASKLIADHTNAREHLDKKEKILLSLFDQLNDDGQDKAVERVEELTDVPKYKRTPPDSEV